MKTRIAMAAPTLIPLGILVTVAMVLLALYLTATDSSYWWLPVVLAWVVVLLEYLVYRISTQDYDKRVRNRHR